MRRYFVEAIPDKRPPDAPLSAAEIGRDYFIQLFELEKTLADLLPMKRKEEHLWLERPVLEAFWRWMGSQSLPSYCPEKKCLNKPEVGAHVQRDSSTDSSWYIIPLCKTHNGKRGETIEVSDTISLVSANVSQTCGK